PVGLNPILIQEMGDGSLVTLNFLDNTASFLTRLPDGSYQVDTVSTGGTHPSSMVVGDLNADGYFDVIIGHEQNGVLTLLLSNGEDLPSEALIIDTGLSFTSLAFSVIQGNRAFYTTTAGVEQAIAFGFDDFASSDFLIPFKLLSGSIDYIDDRDTFAF